VQVCTLLSIKTGGCPEDCAYCPQAARYNTGVNVQALMQKKEVLEYAAKAKAAGSTRFCMGAAWREVRDNKDFDRVLEMVKGVNELGMEVCCTLGMLNEDQAKKLADAGLHAYNHNLDTSPNITTRSLRPEPIMTGYPRWIMSVRPASPFAAAVSSDWVKRTKTGSACCIRWRPCPSTPTASHQCPGPGQRHAAGK
jgi:hypothetical protein